MSVIRPIIRDVEKFIARRRADRDADRRKKERGTLDEPVVEVANDNESPANPVEDPALQLGNPLTSMNPAIVASMFEDAMQGNWTEIQWLFEWVRRTDPIVLALSARRQAALARLRYSIKIPSDVQPEDEALAKEQQDALQKYYNTVDNLPAVFDHLETALFRGYAHVYRKFDGGLLPMQAWWFLRRGMFGEWYYNPEANPGETWQSMPEDAVLAPERWMTWEHPSPVLFVAILAYMRSVWSSRWWDKFCEAVSKLGLVIIGPPQMSEDQKATFKSAARMIALGGSGVIPNGASTEQTNSQRGQQPFQMRLEELRTNLVIAGTGGMLTTLAAPTGIGSGTSEVQDEVFDSLVGADAAIMSSIFQMDIDREILAREFAGYPQHAYFELSRPESQMTPDELAELSGKLSTSGYRVSMASMAETTGLQLEPMPQQPASPIGGSPLPFRAAPDVCQTRNKHVEFAAAEPPADPTLPEAWTKPLADYLQAILRDADKLDAAELQRAIDAIPEQMELMDHDALAAAMEQAMLDAAGAAIAEEANAKPAVAELLESRANITGAVEFAAEPLPAAVEKFLGKKVAPSPLSSAEWDQLPADIRDRAFFSARIESAHLLQAMKNRLANALQIHSDEQGALMDRDAFIREMRQVMEDQGMPLQEGGPGPITDITSNSRLGLIWDMQTTDAAEHARHQMHQDPDVLDAYPVRELIRVESRRVPRNWVDRWRAAGGQLYQGRMIAPVNDPIWTQISRFGKPYPPFDFGSGMGVIDLSRSEAERLGAVPEEQKPEAVDFNQGVDASVSQYDRETLKQLQKALGKSAKDGRIAP